MKILTKLICLSIVAISLLTGCDINSKCNCLIENNVGYFRDVSLSHSFMKNRKIINSSQELRDIFYNNEKDIINKYDDDFFSENALVAVSLLLDASYYDCEVTATIDKETGRMTHAVYKTPLKMLMVVNMFGTHSVGADITFTKDYTITY